MPFDIDLSEVSVRLAELEADLIETAALCVVSKRAVDTTFLNLSEVERRLRVCSDEISARKRATLEVESNQSNRLKAAQRDLRKLDRAIRRAELLARLTHFWTELKNRKGRSDGPN